VVVPLGRAAGALLDRVVEQDGEPARPEDDAPHAVLLVGHQAESAVAMVLVVGAVHALVEARALASAEQVRDDCVVRRLAVNLDALDQEAGRAPDRAFDFRPAARDESERSPAGHVVPQFHVTTLLWFGVPAAIIPRRRPNGISADLRKGQLPSAV